MGSWRFFSKPVTGKHSIRIEWFWRVLHDDGRYTEAQRGFRTLPACQYDASQTGYLRSDQAHYDLANLRWYV